MEKVNFRKLRMGMVGGGPGSSIAPVHRAAAQLDDAIEVVAGAFSHDPEKSRRQGEKLRLDPARVYGSWREMLEREAALPPGRRIDLVCVVTPNHLHYEPAKAALEAGFHVVMDKPMTMNLEQALSLRDTVRQTGRLLALTHVYAANAMVKLARDLVKKGHLGELRKVVVEYPQGWLYKLIEDKSPQARWRTDPALAGAGCVGDIGTHASNLSETVTGLRVTAVAADIGTVVAGRRLEDDFTAFARWGQGVRGSIQASQISPGEGNGLKIRVYGDKAGLEWNHADMDYLTVMYQDKPWERWACGTNYVAEVSPASARCRRVYAFHGDGYIGEFANVYLNLAAAIRCLESGQTPGELDLDFPNVEDGVSGMAFVAAVYESAANGSRWTDVKRK